MSAYHPRTGADPDSPGRDHANQAAASSLPSLEAGKPGPQSADRLAYSIDEAVRMTGLSRDLLYDQMRHGNLTYVKFGLCRCIQQFLGDAPA